MLHRVRFLLLREGFLFRRALLEAEASAGSPYEGEVYGGGFRESSTLIAQRALLLIRAVK